MAPEESSDSALRTLWLKHEGVQKKLLVPHGMRRSELIEAVGELYSISSKTLNFRHGGNSVALCSDLPNGFEWTLQR